MKGVLSVKVSIVLWKTSPLPKKDSAGVVGSWCLRSGWGRWGETRVVTEKDGSSYPLVGKCCRSTLFQLGLHPLGFSLTFLH